MANGGRSPWDQYTPNMPKAPTTQNTEARSTAAVHADQAHAAYEDIAVARQEARALFEIAQSLTISVETVKEHVQNILRKIAVGDRTQAAVWATPPFCSTPWTTWRPLARCTRTSDLKKCPPTITTR